APSMDHVGPMALCVRDLAILLQAIAGPDRRDPLCSSEPVPDYLAQLACLRPPRLARLRDLFDELAEPAVGNLMDSVCDKFESAGACIAERGLPAEFAEVIPRHRVVMAVEAASFHRERLARNQQEYGPCIRALLQEGEHTSAVEYARCK